MTWQQTTSITNGGNGPTEFRLEILGFDYSFCTSMLMTNQSKNPKRIPGLLRTGLTINQEIVFPDMNLKLGSNNFTIVDYQQQAIKAFFRKPTVDSNLLESVYTYSSTFIVDNITNVVSGQYLWIGPECVKVLGVVSGETKYIVVNRAQLGTTAIAHQVSTDLGIALKPVLMDIPRTVEKKKCILYAYGEGDDLQGDGTPIWRGIISADIKTANGINFSIEAQPITELINASCGIDGAEIKLRGINFGPWKWIIKTQLLNTGNIKTGPTTSPEGLYSFNTEIQGFYESVYDLVADINSRINYTLAFLTAAGGSSWAGCTIGCQFFNGEIVFSFSVPSTSQCIRFSTVFAPIEDESGNPSNKKMKQAFVLDVDSLYFIYADGSSINPDGRQTVLTANQTYYQRMKDTKFPQTFTIYSGYDYTKKYPQLANTTAYIYDMSIGQTLFLDTAMIPSTINDIVITDADENTFLRSFPWEYNNRVINETNRSITLTAQILGNRTINNADNPVPATFMTNDTCKIFLGTSFGISTSTSYQPGRLPTITQSKVATIIDFITYLCDHSGENYYNAAMPLMTRDDFDIDDMKTQMSRMTVGLGNNRSYTWFKKVENLKNYIIEEYKVFGAIPALTTDGKMTIRQLRNVNSYETPDYTLDLDEILTDKQFFRMEMNKFGITNMVLLKDDYDPIKGEFVSSYLYRNIDSFALVGQGKTLTIAPQSSYEYTAGRKMFADVEKENLIKKSLSILAYPYQVITLDVPMKYFYAPIGATARIISKNIPNFAPQVSYTDNRRGVNKMLGTIIGKRFDLEKGFGQIDLLVSDQEFAYNDIGQKFILAPDGLCDSVATSGGNIFTFNALNSKPWIQTGKHSDYWSVGQTMKFEKVSTDVQTTGYGKILEVVDNGTYTTFTVNCNSPYSTPSGFTSGTWLFKVPEYNYSYISAAQRIYGFIDSGYVDADNTNRCAGTLSRLLSP